MKSGYVNEGQTPFDATGGDRKLVRKLSRKYYKLGMSTSKARHCRFCKKPMARGVSHICGTKADILPEQIECLKCKTLILKDASYCYYCKAWNERTENHEHKIPLQSVCLQATRTE